MPERVKREEAIEHNRALGGNKLQQIFIPFSQRLNSVETTQLLKKLTDYFT